MSYKVNEIYQINNISNQRGYTYLSGFEYKGEKYSLGWVILNEEGMKKFHTKNPRAEITQHWKQGNKIEAYSVRAFTEVSYCRYNWREIFVYEANLDKYIKSVGIDYRNITVDEIINLPKDQMFYHLETKQIIEGTYTPPGKPKPLFKDWEVPELIIGWIVFILFLIVVFVFKDWYIQLILRVIGLIVFNVWRQQKLFGIK